jgi:protein-S-isoprenylcysteine O-methyltransferase Ste14
MDKFKIHIALTLLVGGAIGVVVAKHPPAWSPMEIVGFALLCAGFVFWTIARFQLGNSFTVSAQAIQLVTSGLYSRIRNPIYVFGSCVIAGLILFLGYPIGLLIFVIIIPMQIWRAGKEAKALEAKFGDEYRAYRASTWF